jgi:N-formylglutamate amidohydrolase
VPLPYEVDQDPDRPDICLGTDQYHTPPEVASIAQEAFENKGYSVSLNHPFAGAHLAEMYDNGSSIG